MRVTGPYKVDADVPLPINGVYPSLKAAMEAMQPGDSIFVKDGAVTEVSLKTACYAYIGKGKFTTDERKEGGVKGTRVWRTQ